MYRGTLCGPSASWPFATLAQSIAYVCSATLGLLLACPAAVARCVDPAGFALSTASITRYFDEKDDQTANPGTLGIRGTGWFLSPSTMVTADHVATAMRLSDQSWKQVEILNDERKLPTPIRILRVAGSNREKLAVLELQNPISGARSLQPRVRPLAAEEAVASIAYPGNRLRIANGRFVQYGESDKLAGTALFEIYDGDDRLVLDHGASGAPVLDCEGRVVAVVSNLLTQTMQFPFRALRISTAWGQPNVVSIPIEVLGETAVVR
jgi:hypothetical protein